MSGWVEGEVIKRIDWHESLFSIQVKADIQSFKAGQFVKLGLPVTSDTGEHHLVARAYSMVNGEQSDVLEFLAVPVEDGTLSPQLHQLQTGDSVSVSPSASGFLVLDEVPEGDDLWMLGTGTGIGPFLAILSSAEAWQRFNHIVLIYAVRHVKDLAYLEHILSWREQHAHFTFIPVISREVRNGSLHGRIPALITNGEIEQFANRQLSAQHSRVMLCGNPGMLEDGLAALQSKGLTKHLRRKPGQILMERYW